MAAQIQEFRFNNSPWRIDWLGSIIYSGSSRSEPRVSVYLSELTANYLDPLSSASLNTPYRHEIVTIKVGQIALLTIGSVWIDGIRALPRKPSHQLSVTLMHDQLELIRFDSEVAIGDGIQPLFAASRYRIGVTAVREVSGSWVVIMRDPTPEIKLLVIPSTVIFQKCFATSPKAVRRLVYGELDKIVDPACGFLKDQPSTFFIELFKDFRDTEGVAMANLKADPVARREFQRFRNTLIVENANQDRGGAKGASSTHMKLSLPFSHTTHVVAAGKYLAFHIDRGGLVKKQWAFLVTELTNLSASLVFDRLVIDRKNNAKQGNNADDPGLPTSWETPTQPPADSEELIPVTSADDPAKDLEQFALEAAGGFEAMGLQIVKEGKDVQQYRGQPRNGANDAESNGAGTTGDPHSGGGCAELDVLTYQAPKVPLTLDHFFETLALLAMQDFLFETIIVSTWFRKRERDHGIVNFLPRKIKGVRSWHLSSDDCNAPPRGYVVAELKHGGVWHYLIELQRKGTGGHALQYIRDHAGGRIDPRRIEQFMFDVARENGWSAKQYYKNWICVSIKHKPSKGVESFAQAIINKL